MAMRMPPQVAQQPVIPEVNRTSLVFFAGFALIILNFYWSNGPKIVNAIWHSDLISGTQTAGAVYFTGIYDSALQLIGLLILVGMAQYGGENAGTAALMFVGALWLLWLVVHVGTKPASEPRASTSEGSKGSEPRSSVTG